jgi:hypothetical protein
MEVTMSLTGKGYFLWQIKAAQDGDPAKIAELAQKAGLSHVLIKVADGIYNYNITKGVDMVPPLVAALRAKGIQPWGWQYIYGAKPVDEARRAAERYQQLGLAGFVVNAEMQFKAKGMASAAHKYMQELRRLLPAVQIGLSTYRYPTVHYQFPFTAFLGYCDFAMPQVYWVESVNPAQQLKKSHDEFRAIFPSKPIIATGAAYAQGSWAPTAAQITDFLNAARNLKLPAANFWEWQTAYERSGLWNAVRDYSWAGTNPPPVDPPPTQNQTATVTANSLNVRGGPGTDYAIVGNLKAGYVVPVLEKSGSWVRIEFGGTVAWVHGDYVKLSTVTSPPPPPVDPPTPKLDIVQRYIAALNSGDPANVTKLYEKNDGRHSHNGQTRKGRADIFAFYNQLLKKSLPNGKFSEVSSSFDGKSWKLSWAAKGSSGKVLKAKDAITMSTTNPNLIMAHSSDFTVVKSLIERMGLSAKREIEEGERS